MRFLRFLAPLFITALIFIAAPCSLHADAAADLLETANKQMASSDYDGAIKSLQDLIQKYPTFLSAFAARWTLGLAQYQKRDYEAALKTLKPLTTDPSAPKEAKEFAAIYLAQAQSGLASTKTDAAQVTAYQDAIKNFTDFLTQYPGSSFRDEGLYGRAYAYLFLKKFAEATADLQTSQKEFPTGSGLNDVIYLLGIVKAQQGQTIAASKVENSTENPDAYYKEARAAFDKVAAAGAEFPSLANDATFQIGELNLATGQYAEAIQTFQKVRPAKELLSQLQQRVQDVKDRILKNPSQFQQLQKLKAQEELKLAILSSKPDPVLDAYTRIATAYVQLGQYNGARALINHLLLFAKPEQAKFLIIQRALSFAQQGKLPQAESELNKFQETYKTDSAADHISFIIGQKYLEAQKWNNALTAFDKSVADYPKGRYSDEAMNGSGTALLKLGRLDEAKKRFEDYASKNKGDPKADRALLQLGDLLVQQKRYADANSLLDTLAKTASDPTIKTEAQFRIAYSQQTEGKLDDALKLYDAFVKSNPSSPLAPMSLMQAARCLEGQGKADNAIPYYQRVVKEYPKDKTAPFAQRAIGYVYISAKPSRTDEALAAFDDLIKLFPDSPEVPTAMFLQGSVLSQIHRTDEARAKYQQIIAQFKTSPVAGDAQFAIAKLSIDKLTGMGNYGAFSDEEKQEWNQLFTESLKQIEELLTTFPDSAAISKALSAALDLQKNKVAFGLQNSDQSQAYFQELITRYSANSDLKSKLQFALAGAQFASGKVQESTDLMKQAYAENPKMKLSPADLDRFGSALLQVKDYALALSVYQKLSAENPNDPYAQANACYGIGTASLRLGKTSDAQTYFERLRKEFTWSDRLQLVNFDLGMSLLDTDGAGALKLFNEVMESQTATPQVKSESMWHCGEILEKQGKLAEAGGYYEKIDTFFGSQLGDIAPKGLMKAGDLYEKSKMPADARRCYETILESYKNTGFFATAKERLAALLTAAPSAQK